MSRLPTIDPTAAADDTKLLLDGVQKKLGMTPNLFRTMANAPAVLKAYLSLSEGLSGGRFDTRSREAIALAVAGASRCDYCASSHTAFSKRLKVDDAEIDRRLNGHANDPKLDAALVFARKIVDKRGVVSDEDLAAVCSAGHDDSDIAEIVGHVAANIFTNYFNHIAQTELDFPKVDLAKGRAA